MDWDVEYTDQFEEWWEQLSEEEQESVAAAVRVLRIQHQGDPYRVLYAFDPRRVAILLLGGNKTGDDRWYETMVPEADRLYDEHLQTLNKEGSTDG